MKLPFLLLVAATGPRVVSADLMDSVNDFLMVTFGNYPDLGPALKPYEVKLRNTKWIYSTINRADTLKWPSEEIKQKAGVDAWGEWKPKHGMSAEVVHGWQSGKKWLLHFKEEDKYMVVGDQVISSNWKEGKHKWNTYHVHPQDPRNGRNREREELERNYKGEDVEDAPVSEEKCKQGKSDFDNIPAWVMAATALVALGFIVGGFYWMKAELAWLWSGNREAIETQIAGESSQEYKAPANSKNKAQKKKEAKKKE